MEELVTKKLYNPYSAKSSYVDACYEAAHRGASPKSTFASIRCNYTKCNLVNALKKINNSICLIGGKEHPYIEDVINDYKEFNPAIEDAYIPNTTCLPQLEAPDKFVKLVNIFLHA